MDDTRELTAARADLAAEARSRTDALRGALDGLLRDIEDDVATAQARGFRAAAEVSLEALVSSFGFERGFLLIGRPSQDIEDISDLEIVATRVATRVGAELDWREVPSPHFAIDRATLVKAFCSDVVVERDRAVSREVGADEPQRPILCRACRITSRSRAVVYLEGWLGDAEGPEHAEVFDWLVERLAAGWGRALLEGEVRRLEGEGQPTSGPDDDPASDEVDFDEAVDHDTSYHGILGDDPALRKVFEIVEKVKDTDLNVCIFGESGTGKELVARAIHLASKRRDREFVSENCGAISESLLESELFGHVKGAFTGADDDRKGLFELADRGTLFLDEISDMPESMQRKLLRALQEGVIRPIGSKDSLNVDVRVLCASNRDLKHLVERGEFRADLYYRLNVITIEVPPLRERRGDIPALVRHFTREVAEHDGVRKRLSASARTALEQYGWPGNVRELRNVVRRVLLTSSRRMIARKDVLPFLGGGAQGAACLGENVARDDDELILRIPARQTFNEIIDECERLILTNALKENGWNKSRVTKVLGIPRQSLYNKIAKHELTRPGSGDGELANAVGDDD